MRSARVFLAVLATTAVFSQAQYSSVDEGFIHKTTLALVERGEWRMGEELSGRRYSRFSPLPSLWNAPFVFVARKLTTDPARIERNTLFAAGLASCVLAAITAVLVFGWLQSIGHSPEVAEACGCLSVLGTLLLPYASTLFHQNMVAPLLVGVCWAFSCGSSIWLASCLALAVACQLNLVVLLPALLLAVRDGGAAKPLQMSLASVGGAAVGAAFCVLVNHLRGDPLFSGAYEGEAFTTPVEVGLWGLLLGAGKGLLAFSPLTAAGLAILIPFASSRPNPGKLVLYIVSTQLAFVACWWAWHGSLTWGPRLLLPFMPLCVIPIADALSRVATLEHWQRRAIGVFVVWGVVASFWAATRVVGFVEAVPGVDIAEAAFVPNLSPWAGASASAAATKFLFDPISPPSFRVAGYALAAGAALLLVVMVWSTRSLHGTSFVVGFPWTAAVLLIAAGAVRWSEPTNQYQNLETADGGSRLRGSLVFPIRGVYSLFVVGRPDESIRIGRTVLRSQNEPVQVDLPAGALPIEVAGKKSGSSPTLRWTIPGGGRYRERVPADYLTASPATTWQSRRILLRLNVWVLYVLAALAGVRWLTAGDRTKPA